MRDVYRLALGLVVDWLYSRAAVVDLWLGMLLSLHGILIFNT